MHFPDALERGLTGTGSSARRGLETILGWTAGRTDADPWTGSLLTMPGFPVEFAFSSGDRGVRYCAEVEDPRRCPQGRLEAAEALLRQCTDMARPDESVMTEFRSLQSQGALGYGCWIGGRATAVERNRFKLYVEIPEAASEAATAWEEALCGSRRPSFPGQTFPVTMAGYDLASGRMEFYHRALDAPSTVVALLLRRIGLEHRAPEILDVLQKAYRFRLGGRLPSRDAGFSYAASGQDPVVFTLYFYCCNLFGGDAASRAGILRLADEFGWDMSHYSAFTEPLSEAAHGVRTRHGMFGLTVAEGRPLTISVGAAPPDPIQ